MIKSFFTNKILRVKIKIESTKSLDKSVVFVLFQDFPKRQTRLHDVYVNYSSF